MTIGAIRSARWLGAASVVALSVVSGSVAMAQDAPPSSETPPPPPPAPAPTVAPPPAPTTEALPTPPPAATKDTEKKESTGEGGHAKEEGTKEGAGHEEHKEGGKEEGKEHEEEHHLAHVSFDAVIGFGSKLLAATQGDATSNSPIPPFEQGLAKVKTESFVLGLMIDIVEGVSVGGRIPLTIGEVTPSEGNPTRTTSTPGNLELEGEYELELSHELKFVASLGLALPTAQGSELPENETLRAMDPGTVQQATYDRGIINRAASMARGLEDSALFEPHRLGIIPKVGIDYFADGLSLAPFLKVENLIRTQDDLEHKYIGELVIGARAAYRVQDHLDLGIRLWTNINFAGTDDKVGVVQPEVRGHFGKVQPYIGWVFPFAGKVLTDPYTTGARFGVAAAF